MLTTVLSNLCFHVQFIPFYWIPSIILKHHTCYNSFHLQTKPNGYTPKPSLDFMSDSSVSHHLTSVTWEKSSWCSASLAPIPPEPFQRVSPLFSHWTAPSRALSVKSIPLSHLGLSTLDIANVVFFFASSLFWPLDHHTLVILFFPFSRSLCRLCGFALVTASTKPS